MARCVTAFNVGNVTPVPNRYKQEADITMSVRPVMPVPNRYSQEADITMSVWHCDACTQPLQSGG